MDIGEKRLPQDGRFRMTLAKGQSLDFRVSSLPTIYGEKIVIRILDSSQVPFDINEIGFEEDEKELLLQIIARPYGMVLVTGPTGSGKSTTLYNCLHILNRPEVNILTVEDPVEINLPGINQVNVNEQIGRTFASVLSTFLRQDPDIIMVGEIRDVETADIAIKAAQTGLMVFSTLHTNDAPGAIERLRNMGIAPFNLTSSLLLVIAQRLGRKVSVCKEPSDVSPSLLARAGLSEIDANWKLYKPKGCAKCNQTGYKGRQAIFQMMPLSEEMKDLILRGGSSLELAKLAEKEGVRTLRQSGLIKVKKGITSLEEVLSVT
jgi:type IV pilus assembly protein PilB